MARAAHARTEQKSAPLASDFGISYATRLFGQEAIDSLPTLQAGPNKGKPKGHVIWLKTTTAGYHPNIGGGVAAGVVVRAWIGLGPLSDQGSALTGKWMGRPQQLCGSRALLGDENRRAWMAEQERAAP